MYQNYLHAILALSPACIHLTIKEKPRRFVRLKLYEYCHFREEISAVKISTFGRN